MSLQSTEQVFDQTQQIENSSFKSKVIVKLQKLLSKRPYCIAALAELTGLQRQTITRYIDYLREQGIIKSVEGTFKPVYYQLAGFKIPDLESLPIASVAECYFYEIPIIKRWYSWAKNNPSRLDDLQTFKRICYGKIVHSFRINPSKWVHPATTEELHIAYLQQYSSDYPPHVVDAIKTFLVQFKKVILPRSELEFLGLKIKAQTSGKHRFLRLTDEEIAKAEVWLESPACIAAIEQYNKGHSTNKITVEEVQAHWAFATEGFPRPSRCLTIEVSKVQKHKNGDSICLQWEQLETKQDKLYHKLMLDTKLIEWAINWLERRRENRYKFLFVDNNNYEPHVYDSNELRAERERYATIYKVMFRALNKTESVWYEDTLYALRHVGVQKWIARCGMSAYALLAQMGWESVDTLIGFYGAMTSGDILKAIQQAAKS